jgi:hypothetical protein
VETVWTRGMNRREAGQDCIMRSFVTCGFIFPKIRLLGGGEGEWQVMGEVRHAQRISVGKYVGTRSHKYKP